MPQFSRKTLLAATDCLTQLMSHAEIDRFLLEYGLEDVVPSEGSSKQARANALARHLLADPERTDEDGRNLIDALVEDLVHRAIENTGSVFFDDRSFEETFPFLVRGLDRLVIEREGCRRERTWFKRMSQRGSGSRAEYQLSSVFSESSGVGESGSTCS